MAHQSRSAVEGSGNVGRLDVIEFAGLLGVQSIPEVHGLLEIEPELGLSVSEPSKTEGGVRCDRTLPLYNLVHPGIRHAEPLSSVLLRDPEWNEEVLEEHLAGMGGAAVLGQTHA
jgi:hypothetical protein